MMQVITTYLALQHLKDVGHQPKKNVGEIAHIKDVVACLEA